MEKHINTYENYLENRNAVIMNRDGFSTEHTDPNRLRMSEEEVENAMIFEGKECCRFKECKDKNVAVDALKLIRDYGSSLTDREGRVISWFYGGDDGKRVLLRCEKCGALFLVQYNRDSVSFWDDDYYICDEHYFQVESEEQAEKLNLLLSGNAINNYKAPHFSICRNG